MTSSQVNASIRLALRRPPVFRPMILCRLSPFAGGWRTQWAALLMAGLTLVINVYMHDFWNVYEGGSAQHELQNFIKNLGIFAGLLILAARGAPRASLDARSAAR